MLRLHDRVLLPHLRLHAAGPPGRAAWLLPEGAAPAPGHAGAGDASASNAPLITPPRGPGNMVASGVCTSGSGSRFVLSFMNPRPAGDRRHPHKYKVHVSKKLPHVAIKYRTEERLSQTYPV